MQSYFGLAYHQATKGRGAGFLVAKSSAVCGLLVKPGGTPTAHGTSPRVFDSTCTSLQVLTTDAGGWVLDWQRGRKGPGWEAVLVLADPKGAPTGVTAPCPRACQVPIWLSWVPALMCGAD